MNELRDLYQEAILDHYKHPRNFGVGPGRSANGANPLCGDSLSVYADVQNGVICDIHFVGQGCAISTASASLMTEAVKGKSVGEAHTLFHKFHRLLTSDSPAGELGKLEVFGGVREFPSRVKCATLAWHTLEAALTGTSEAVTTE